MRSKLYVIHNTTDKVARGEVSLHLNAFAKNTTDKVARGEVSLHLNAFAFFSKCKNMSIFQT